MLVSITLSQLHHCAIFFYCSGTVTKSYKLKRLAHAELGNVHNAEASQVA